MTCLDVGCGTGEVMRLMGLMVGPEGHVTGIDTDGGLGGEALSVLLGNTRSRFAFVAQDVERLAEVPRQPFDVTGRIVLLHLRDPIATLRKMYRWTKPGGWIVVQQYDWKRKPT